MTKITSRLLKSKGACSEQVALFKELGGDTKPLTLALCLKHADKFDWDWAASNLLKPPAYAGYDRARDAARAGYERVMAPARADYDRVQGPARAGDVRVWDAAYAGYVRVWEAAYAGYVRVQARAFWKAFNSEANQ